MSTKSSKKILSDRVKASEIVSSWLKEGKKVVFTNGCFDILHAGHVEYLEKASEKGDYMVIGLNSDSSVRNIKGPERPIVTQHARARVLAALGFVDLVVFFDEDTPLQLIQQLKPSTLIKGADYNISNIVGADFVIENGGSVETIELVEGFSTTNIIDKIKGL
ncbi:D-glycero-beta-D-manno-heptose 1-phosphate adenylyltransferase [Marinigracilibium pacificum]|uniref:D-glycero-beta-D-manno-heptose 1-phosphate adenylyltransferase n=1 Tax=Marinigracilibium pacificum TaxID=2729599 RepID=A0A848IXS1_9BACT|nr:D-glycero-beta-D-manno-heptose 1-phosphate adenylyltransferase [Marinigracilibium pacificum]NMM47044.1 D-glycero-beta-D-manno-heptose 1-phosphate adenylyltransferase [Marinigracilibium pacificum]